MEGVWEEYLGDIGIQYVSKSCLPPAARGQTPITNAPSPHSPAREFSGLFPLTPTFRGAGVITPARVWDGVPNDSTLDTLRREIGDCTRCKLSGGRTKLVFGVGNPNAALMFVGEAPGYEEDLQGLPFVGKAGQLLSRMIAAMGYKREDVYIANVIKCRPPQNRNPEPDEIATCKPFLERQIEMIQPKAIVCLGNFAAQTLLNTDKRISGLRGQFREYRGIPLMATYHPAYLLRSPEMKKPVWEDLKRVMVLLQSNS